MTVRATMAELITRLRLLIGDPAGASPTFSDQELQDILDRHQGTVRYATLEEAPTIDTKGYAQYFDYYAVEGDWEADAIVQNGNYQPLTPSASDYQTGHWTFNYNQLPPVLIVGKTYDLYAAAVDALEAWQAKVALEYSFSVDGQSFQRGQKAVHLAGLADLYRKRVRTQMAVICRSDLT